MNDSVNLSLYSELVRFQVDLSKLEVRFSYPSNEMQRNLQSFAHGLGLEYEYFLDSREARITRAVVSTAFAPAANDFLPGLQLVERPGSENTSGGSSNIYTNETVDQQSISTSAIVENLGFSFESDSLDFATDELLDVIFPFDWGSNDVEPWAEEPGLRTSLMQGAIHKSPALLSAQNLPQHSDVFYKAAAQGCGDMDMSRTQLQMRDGIFDFNCSQQGPYHELSLSSAAQNDQLIFSPFSWTLSSKMQDEDLASSFSDASLFSSRQAGSRSSSISSVHSNRGRSKISKMSSRRSCTYRQDNSAGFQEFIFNSRPAKCVTSSGRQGPLNAIARAAMNAVTAAGACWRCKYLRKSVNASNTLKSFIRTDLW
jgi:hypothetical protein